MRAGKLAITRKSENGETKTGRLHNMTCFSVQFCIETLCKASNFGGTFSQLLLWIFLWNFQKWRCLSTSFIIIMVQKVKSDHKLKSRGGGGVLPKFAGLELAVFSDVNFPHVHHLIVVSCGTGGQCNSFKANSCGFDPDDQPPLTPTAYLRRQSLTVWQPTLNKKLIIDLLILQHQQGIFFKKIHLLVLRKRSKFNDGPARRQWTKKLKTTLLTMRHNDD